MFKVNMDSIGYSDKDHPMSLKKRKGNMMSKYLLGIAIVMLSTQSLLAMEESYEEGGSKFSTLPVKANRSTAKVERDDDKIPNPECFMLGNEQENRGLLHLATTSYNLAFEEKEKEEAGIDSRSSPIRQQKQEDSITGQQHLTQTKEFHQRTEAEIFEDMLDKLPPKDRITAILANLDQKNNAIKYETAREYGGICLKAACTLGVYFGKEYIADYFKTKNNKENNQ